MDSLEPASSMPSSSASPGICSSDNYDEMTSADSEFQFPWKQREILTFDIPVHDSERAGLGVSVKGKTSTSRGRYTIHSGQNAIFPTVIQYDDMSELVFPHSSR